jgi:hypothetical protein
MLLSLRAPVDTVDGEYQRIEIAMNPGLREFGSRISQVAELYDRYRIENLRIKYSPICSAVTPGAIFIAYTADAMGIAPIGPAGAMASESAIQCPVYQKCSLDVHCSRDEFYVRDLGVDYGQLQVYDNGKVFIFVPQLAESTPLGQLYFEYDVLLSGTAPRKALDEVAQRDEGWVYNNTFEERYTTPLAFPKGAFTAPTVGYPFGQNYWATGGAAFISKLEPIPASPEVKQIVSTCVEPSIYNASSVNEFGTAPGGFNQLERGVSLFVGDDLYDSVELPSLNYLTRSGAAIYNPALQGTNCPTGEKSGRSAHYFMDTETALAAGLHEKYLRAGFGPVLKYHDKIRERMLAGEEVGVHEIRGFPALLGQVFRWAPKVLTGVVSVSRLVLGINDAINTWKFNTGEYSAPLEFDRGTSAQMRDLLSLHGLTQRPKPIEWSAPGALAHPASTAYPGVHFGDEGDSHSSKTIDHDSKLKRPTTA